MSGRSAQTRSQRADAVAARRRGRSAQTRSQRADAVAAHRRGRSAQTWTQHKVLGTLANQHTRAAQAAQKRAAPTTSMALTTCAPALARTSNRTDGASTRLLLATALVVTPLAVLPVFVTLKRSVQGERGDSACGRGPMC